ncbi:HSF-type DNA-binding-domain-containing protein, partial [Pelagophyceae sp. CCMP2097]
MDGSLVAYPLAQLQQHVALHLQFQPQSQFQPPRPPREAAAALHDAAVVLKRRRCAVAVDEVPGFVRTVFTLLRVCDPDVISWSPNGAQIVIRDSDRFASEVCPKFFRHRNLHSFTRLLNMYQFHKVPTTQRDSKDVSFEHPHFQRGRDDLLSLVQRK